MPLGVLMRLIVSFLFLDLGFRAFDGRFEPQHSRFIWRLLLQNCAYPDPCGQSFCFPAFLGLNLNISISSMFLYTRNDRRVGRIVVRFCLFLSQWSRLPSSPILPKVFSMLEQLLNTHLLSVSADAMVTCEWELTQAFTVVTCCEKEKAQRARWK